MKGLLCWAALLLAAVGFAQKKTNPVYVDASGVLRWTNSKKEAAFFGVNYTVPFAYGYRSHKALGIDPEKAIDTDVAHMARLGFDAFRVHVWDTEITDSAGNLLQNEHLRLFDYLLLRLKERGIKILITPLAFWGNGYPEPDQNTGSFSSKYNKRQVLVTPQAIAAQENYLQQFFRHVNPYTETTYGNDPDVVAMEINNEPHHSGPKPLVTEYINRMAAAVRSTGWTKPVFYNISESPAYADAVAAAKVDGHSFQWYPTGLVANRTLQGNFLPNVDRYHIPFIDTIPAFRNRARMVYEFDAGDVIGTYMYPAMARSFRTAGFQWATQFAYDPLYTAHTNIEYQTHYLNLAYTPGKAIGLMIAGKAFHLLPRGKGYGTYPADSVFDGFRVSYARDLSEWNTDTAFFHTANTSTQPINPAALRHIAGVGSSPLVQYNGTGAYFLDRIGAGLWRLEVLPDVFQTADPFGKAAPARTVRRLLYQGRNMQVNLPQLGGTFKLQGNKGTRTVSGGFEVEPGVYYLGEQEGTGATAFGSHAFPVQPLAPDSVLFTHTPHPYVAAGQNLTLEAQVAGCTRVVLEWQHHQGWQQMDMVQTQGFSWQVTVPAGFVTPGPVAYRIWLTDKSGIVHLFPGNQPGDPYRWDAPATQVFNTVVVPATAALVLFDATTDAGSLSLHASNWQRNTIGYTAGAMPPYVQQLLATTDTAKGSSLGWQRFVGDINRGLHHRKYQHLNIKAEGDAGGEIKVVLKNKAGHAYGAILQLREGTADYRLPLDAFKPVPGILLPRPYPGFQALNHDTGEAGQLEIATIDLLQVWVKPLQQKAIEVKLQTISLQ